MTAFGEIAPKLAQHDERQQWRDQAHLEILLGAGPWPEIAAGNCIPET